MPRERKHIRSNIKNGDLKNTTPTGSRKNLKLQKEIQPLLTVTPAITRPKFFLDLADGQRLSTINVQRGPRISSSDTFTRSISREVACAIPWDTSTTPIPFHSARDLLDSNITDAIEKDDIEALEESGITLLPKVAEKALLLSCRQGSNAVVKYLLKSGVNVNCKDFKSGLDCISTAVYFDHGDVIETLLSEIPVDSLVRIELHSVTLSLLHLACHYSCLNSVKALVNSDKFNLQVDDSDSNHWKPIHYAVGHDNKEIVKFLLAKGGNPNAEGPYKVRPLHVAAYRNSVSMVELLLDNSADPSKQVTLNPPRYSFSFGLDLDYRKSSAIPAVVNYNATSHYTLLHWAVAKALPSTAEKMLDCGSVIDVNDLQGRSPVGMALMEAKTDFIKIFTDRGIKLSDEDKNWRRIVDEEKGLKVVDILERTNLDVLNCSNKEGFSILHLAASKGYLSLLTKLLNKRVAADLETVKGETPLFFAIENNHQACVQQLIKSGCNICHISKKNASVLHIAAKFNNFAAIDLILNLIACKKKSLDLNLADDLDFTATYYAITAGRYDIVQRFVQFCVSQSIHVKATKEETLLQFYTERNILGQYDNAIIRVLEHEKELHNSKFTAEKCLRMQLGTTEASTKAREQLQAMYNSTSVQRHCYNFWIIISCFLMPSIFYYLDVYTDVVLAIEYFNVYTNGTHNVTESSESTGMAASSTELQDRFNLYLTSFFILFPMGLLTIWSIYIHLTQEDIMPHFKTMSRFQRALVYVIVSIPPLGPIVSFIENSYAQVKYRNENAKICDEPGAMSLLDEDRSREQSLLSARMRGHYNLKNIAQMRVAINNVLEATLESAFQLILQLYILGTQYKDLKKLQFGEITLGSILSLSPTNDQESRLSKQVLSVIISLLSLTWSFTSYHRFSKLGGLRILWSLPLLFAIFFQIISRAIACTVFTLAYAWRIFIVLIIHCVLMVILKLFFERRTPAPKSKIFCSNPLFSCLRLILYVAPGAFMSTFVYFRIERPLGDKDQLSQRHSSFTIQSCFLVLALVENIVLLSLGVAHLSDRDYDSVFKITASVLCLLSFIIGVILQWVYYGCFGHPWVNINGPSVETTGTGTVLISFNKDGGQSQWVFKSCGDCTHHFEEEEDHVYLPKINGYVKAKHKV